MRKAPDSCQPATIAELCRLENQIVLADINVKEMKELEEELKNAADKLLTESIDHINLKNIGEHARTVQPFKASKHQPLIQVQQEEKEVFL
ncbi:unnamed protein product [Caenorhabditis brenneri]